MIATTQYMIVEGNEVSLVELVNEYIKQGWQPLGGVAVFQHPQSPNLHYFYQAMIRTVDDPSERLREAN